MGNAGTNGEAAGDFVCRVCVPEERLTPSQANGFALIGFAVPFVVFGLLTRSLGSFSLFIAALVVAGLVMVVRGGVKLSRRWWRNAGMALGNGASQGFTIALFVTLMFSCTAGLGRVGYMGRGF